VLLPVDQGGEGVDACWQASFYHHLIGDAQPGQHYARLLYHLAEVDQGPVPLARFAEALLETSPRRVVYHESHDEAGNSSYVVEGERRFSRRTIQVAAAGHDPETATGSIDRPVLALRPGFFGSCVWHEVQDGVRGSPPAHAVRNNASPRRAENVANAGSAARACAA